MEFRSSLPSISRQYNTYELLSIYHVANLQKHTGAAIPREYVDFSAKKGLCMHRVEVCP
jgi:hypothetical protein